MEKEKAKEMRKWKQIEASAMYKAKLQVKSAYGFTPDLNKSARENALTLFNSLPPHLRSLKPRTSAFHNLCRPNINIPPTVKSLLGLNLNFCPTPPTSTKITQVQLERLHKNMKTRLMFSNGEPLPECALFVPNDEFQPRTPHNLLKTRCENVIGKLRKEFGTKNQSHRIYYQPK